MRTGIVLALVVLCVSVAPADDGIPTAGTHRSGRHLIYFEALGKAGEYGVGYEYQLMPWLSIGAAGSFSVIRDQQVITVAPYLHATMLGGGPHALYTELGGILAHSRIVSSVPDWEGMSDTGGGGFMTLGYEHASEHLVLRPSASIVAGEGGLAPMVGFSIGWRP